MHIRLFLLLFFLQTFVCQRTNAQPDVQKFVITDSFMTYMKTVLNPYKYGWENDRFYPYSTRYGRRTGWGLPVNDKKLYQTGQTEQEADLSLKKAIGALLLPLDSLLKKDFDGRTLTSLSKDAQQILIDRAVTEGINNLPPAFCKAVITEDWNTLVNSYLYVRSPEGWPDIIRNKAFAERWIHGKTGKPLSIDKSR